LNLGETCKTFYLDENRKDEIQKKIIKTWFYTSSPLILGSYSAIFPNLLDFYFDHLKKIQISDHSLKTLQPTLPFFTFAFLNLTDKEKNLMIKNLVQNIYDIWRIWKVKKDKESNKEEIHYIHIPLFVTFENILKSIFIRENNYWRCYILDILYDFSKKTKSTERLFPKNRFSYNDQEPDRYTLDQFICSLSLGYWKDLSVIVEIGDFLETYDEMYLYDFLYKLFYCFINCQYLYSMKEDEYVEMFEDQLDKFYDMSSKKTYKHRLLELFTSCHYMIHEEFENALEFRSKRLQGIDDEEDFDY
jgi:hypothetical protein